MRWLLTALLTLTIASNVIGQQVPDSAFTFHVSSPAFLAGAGPIVCVDAGHENFHTLDDRYYSFGKLVRGDGFRTKSVAGRFSRPILSDCGVLVIANAAVAPIGSPARMVNASAFGPDEISEVFEWVYGGGRLLLIMDHWPVTGATGELASILGAVPLNGGATYRLFGDPEPAVRAVVEKYGVTPDSVHSFLGPLGTLGKHSIMAGRGPEDPPVRAVMTFGGSAFYPAEDMDPLLEVPAGARGSVWLPGTSQQRAPRFAIDKWAVGGARELGTGRIVVLGEAAMCSAQLGGPERAPMGMNDELAVDNALFCLNVVRWLAGVIH